MSSCASTSSSSSSSSSSRSTASTDTVKVPKPTPKKRLVPHSHPKPAAQQHPLPSKPLVPPPPPRTHHPKPQPKLTGSKRQRDSEGAPQPNSQQPRLPKWTEHVAKMIKQVVQEEIKDLPDKIYNYPKHVVNGYIEKVVGLQWRKGGSLWHGVVTGKGILTVAHALKVNDKLITKPSSVHIHRRINGVLSEKTYSIVSMWIHSRADVMLLGIRLSTPLHSSLFREPRLGEKLVLLSPFHSTTQCGEGVVQKTATQDTCASVAITTQKGNSGSLLVNHGCVALVRSGDVNGCDVIPTTWINEIMTTDTKYLVYQLPTMTRKFSD